MHFSLKTLILCVIVAIVANNLFVYADDEDDDDNDNDKPTLEADTKTIVDWVIILNHFIVIAIRLLICSRYIVIV